MAFPVTILIIAVATLVAMLCLARLCYLLGFEQGAMAGFDTATAHMLEQQERRFIEAQNRSVLAYQRYVRVLPATERPN